MESRLGEPAPSRFEELDPDPAPRRLRRSAWEARLAGALLAAVVLFGGGTWLHGALAASAYQQGVGAEAARHWDTAQAAFAAAGAYQDAPARATAAAGQAQYLSQTYALLQAARQGGDWLQAWHLAGAIAAVQPDYRDIAAQTAAAYAALFRQGAAGLIYLRAQGPDPGLSLLGADGTPLALPDSTAASRVLATDAADSRFLYSAEIDPLGAANNVCQPGADRRPPPTPAARVVLARPAGQAAPSTQILPAAFDPAGSFWLTRHGLWGATLDGRLAYYDQASGLVQPGPTLDRDTQVAGVAPDADSLLLIRALRPAGDSAQTQALRLAPDGQSTPAAAVPGFLLTASVSADGRYAALFVEDVQAGISRTLYLADFRARAPADAPVLLDRIAWRGVVLAAGLRATFVPGASTAQLLIEHQDDGGLTIWRYLLPSKPLMVAAIPGTILWSGADAIQRDDRSSISPDGRSLAFRTQLDGRPFLALVPITGGVPLAVVPIHLVGGQMVDSWFAPRSDFVVYRARNPDGLDKGTTEAVWSLPVPPGAGQPPQLLAVARRLYDPAFPTLALPASGALAAYLTPDGDLHARTLDGAAETTLASGVDAVWALGEGH